jgi:pimeloyl-ACP methyl ester carboxylesterase
MPTHQILITRDGTRVVYAEHGSGPALLYVRGWLSHLEIFWERPQFRSFIEELGRHHRVYWYDVRGTGLSQQDSGRISFGTLVAELEDLVDELGLGRFVLYGASFGGPIAIAYAARHPERIERLVLDGTYARGSDIASPLRRWLLTLALRYFPEMGYLLLSGATHPDPKRSSQKTIELGERMSAPRSAAKLYSLGFRVNVRKLLKSISAETLVIHRDRSRSIPIRLGRKLANEIPGARFVELTGQEHNSWEGNAGETMDVLASFLGFKRGPAVEATDESSRGAVEDTARRDGIVFVSYAHADSPSVQLAIEWMEQESVQVWYDSGITAGSLWRDEIAIAVQRCSVFVLFVSKSSVESRYCDQEIGFAIDEGKPILPVFLEQTDVPSRLRMLLGPHQAIFAYTETTESYRARLIQGVRTCQQRAQPS